MPISENTFFGGSGVHPLCFPDERDGKSGPLSLTQASLKQDHVSCP